MSSTKENFMEKQIKVVLLGAGNRADIYASVSLEFPEMLKVVGIVDPDPIRRNLIKEKYSIPDENTFECVEEFVKKDKFADAVINGTMDHLHVKTSIPVLEKGYDLLLEKPFALSNEEVDALLETARKYKNRVVICHVLRYTAFYKSIKNHILNGDIGKIISIESCEHVNYHHMAVSFVRGKWRSEKLCFAPMLLAKSCHDTDIMLWLMGMENAPKSVASFGSDFQFGKDKKPEGAGDRCMTDCPYVDECRFSAKANYLAAPRWKQYVWKSLEGRGELTEEMKEESLKTDNPYGLCAWNFERDGNVDHQAVTVNFANGATGSFAMIGGAAKSERNIHIVGTHGEIKGTFEDSHYVLRQMDPSTALGYKETVYDLDVKGDKIGAMGAHGGGDVMLVIDFVEYMRGNEPSISCATLEDSAISHRTVFAATKARVEKRVVDIENK